MNVMGVPAARRLPPLPTVKDILRFYKISATKKLSQNFIMDPRLLDRFARLAEVQGKQQGGPRQEVSREEVARIVREVLPAQPDNQERGEQPGYNQI